MRSTPTIPKRTAQHQSLPASIISNKKTTALHSDFGFFMQGIDQETTIGITTAITKKDSKEKMAKRANLTEKFVKGM